MALFSIEHMFESRVTSELWTTKMNTCCGSNHSGRVKRAGAQKAAQGNSTATTANSNHLQLDLQTTHQWFRDARCRSLLNQPVSWLRL